MPSDALLVGAFFGALALVPVFAFVRSQLRSRGKVFPPGPPADPVIGHVRSMPLEYAWRTFGEWGKKWGGLIYVNVLGKPMVIINKLEVARELLDKRGAVYSDRPRLVLLCEMMGWDNVLAFLPYGDRFRKHRRLMQQHFNVQSVANFRNLQKSEIYTLLENLLIAPGQFRHHFHRLSSATMTMATYGHQVVSDDDAYVSLVEKANAMTVQSGSPGGTPVDFFPPLRHIPTWMPGAGFKRHALKARELIMEMLDMPFNMVKENRLSGTAKPSFISYLLDEYERNNKLDEEHEQDIKAVGGVLYGAGVETSESSLLTFMLAMVRHPEVVKRAQAEIDAAVGRDRMPNIDDRDSLPYIDCILKETLRWNPPVPLCIPHRNMSEDMFEGKSIPDGSMIIPNIWQMMRDERYYPNPDQFNPERFFVKTVGGLSEEDYDPRGVVFGFGRRVCPGKYFADYSMWLTMATVLAALDILPPLDENGKEVVPEAIFTTGTASQPKAFECRIAPRSEKYAALIRQEVEFLCRE